ncbi:cell wall integrity and stress response component 2-like [Stylophora pistillata]|uniref:cell wall integrity and stress response component 2-like n=1 Tax=Stylophora pistillata TaxID=50429 RepID=UPI000C03D33D|nr:cell wall integrity and stress response component 2-like [Stylophora pistillata]
MTRKELINFLQLRFQYIVIQAIVAVLSSCIQLNQASTITVSPSSSMVSHSSVLQRGFTAMTSWSVVRTTTSSFQKTSVAPSSSNYFSTSSSSSMTPSSVVQSKNSKTFTTSVSCATSTSQTLVTQYKHTAVHVTPTKVVIYRIRGIPSMKVITVVASVLGAILLVLLAIIIWDLCIVEILPRRPTSRVEPRNDVSHVCNDMV